MIKTPSILLVNKDTFLRLVDHPNQISDDDLEKLEDVVQIFPYCSLAYTLIAKGHFERATMFASQKLRRAAAYALDRETLKVLLLQGFDTEDDEEVEVLSAPTTGDTISETHATKEKPDELDALVAESSRVHLSENLLESGPSVSSEERFKLLDSTEEETPPMQLGHLNEDEEMVHRFGKRLKKNIQQDIIDTFIKSDQRISTFNLNKVAITDRDLSESSTRPPEIISENLANILIKQGKVDKAVEMYEKLMLKFPEKKVYFASRIEDLKNL